MDEKIKQFLHELRQAQKTLRKNKDDEEKTEEGSPWGSDFYHSAQGAQGAYLVALTELNRLEGLFEEFFL